MDERQAVMSAELRARVDLLANHYTREELLIEVKKMLARELESIRQLKNYGGGADIRLHNHAITILNGIIRRLEYGKRNE